jgi:hypothetical protein
MGVRRRQEGMDGGQAEQQPVASSSSDNGELDYTTGMEDEGEEEGGREALGGSG